MLKGTHTKHQDLNDEENADLWPAIPIMRDALKCLEEISRVTFNPYLISGCETVRLEQHRCRLVLMESPVESTII